MAGAAAVAVELVALLAGEPERGQLDECRAAGWAGGAGVQGDGARAMVVDGVDAARAMVVAVGAECDGDAGVGG